MRICLICVEIFAWGKYGGFGRSTRFIGRELVRRGIEVTAVVPRRPGQRRIEYLDGIRIIGFESRNLLSSGEIFREVDADIYHSQEPSFGTYLAQRAMPHKKHIVTFRDTRTFRDWWIEYLYPALNKMQVISNYFYEDNFLVHQAVQKADAWFAASNLLISKSREKYKLPGDPVFLPSPVPFWNHVEKSVSPMVVFVGRFDRRKRPERFFDLVHKFPRVHFVAVGVGRDSAWEQGLLSRYRHLSNLEVRGFVDQFLNDDLFELLGKSWVLVNTSARESLPTSFIEAVAHGCAILSEIDPDGFSSRFGHHVEDQDYERGLHLLLSSNTWRERVQAGMEYVRETFSPERSIERHMQIYRELTGI